MAHAHGFSRTPNQDLVCDGVSLASIASAEGTPLYVYSAALLRDRYRALDAAFAGYPHAIHYALKANSTLALARLLRTLGASADANSVWEIAVAQRAGFEPKDIVFTGVGKTAAELECAVSLNVKAINVESAGELDRVEAIAARLGRVARVAVRVNPDIDAKSHPHISTGLKINKFGVPLDDARALLASVAKRPSLKLVGVHVHVGSQVTTLEPLRRAARFVAELSAALTGPGGPVPQGLEYMDLGGGLGVSYDGSPVPTPKEYVDALLSEAGKTNLPVVIEPGRSMIAPVGVLVASVVDIKPRTAESEFVVIDAGMTELLRPAMYGAYHAIEPVTGPVAQGFSPASSAGPVAQGFSRASSATRQYEIVGPVCESSDVVGRDRELPLLNVGDLVAIRDAGAYGSAMASNYNRRPLPAEVLVDDGSYEVIRRRQTVDDMIRLES